eukprot:SAG31_NODE_1220_length_9296_cov_3.409046_10_plen_227_part_00
MLVEEIPRKRSVAVEMEAVDVDNCEHTGRKGAREPEPPHAGGVVNQPSLGRSGPSWCRDCDRAVDGERNAVVSVAQQVEGPAQEESPVLWQPRHAATSLRSCIDGLLDCRGVIDLAVPYSTVSKGIVDTHRGRCCRRPCGEQQKKQGHRGPKRAVWPDHLLHMVLLGGCLSAQRQSLTAAALLRPESIAWPHAYFKIWGLRCVDTYLQSTGLKVTCPKFSIYANFR